MRLRRSSASAGGLSLPTTSGPTRAGCNGDDDAETVILPAYYFAGVYPAAEWKKAAKIVEKVGRAHGFDVVKVVVDRPGDFTMTGLSKVGGSYDFGMAQEHGHRDPHGLPRVGRQARAGGLTSVPVPDQGAHADADSILGSLSLMVARSSSSRHPAGRVPGPRW